MEEQIKIANEYLRLGKIDLEAAKKCYNYGIFNIALFELQQAIEKVTKCFCLAVNIWNGSLFSLEEISHSHNSIDFLMKMLEKFISVLENKNGLKNPLFNVFKSDFIENINRQKEMIKKINGREGFEEINRQVESLEGFDLSKIGHEQIESIIKENYKGIAGSSVDLKKTYDKALEVIDKEPFFRIFSKIFIPLSLLGALTFKHESSTRYPYKSVDEKGKVDYYVLKPEDYRKGLGVVDAFPKLEDILNKTIQKLEEETK